MVDRTGNGKKMPKANKKPQKIGNGHKVFTITVFAVLSIYLLGYLFVFLSKPSVSIETVSYGSIDVPATLRGIIVRDEIVVVNEMEGEAHYNYAENEKVAKNAVVCTVKESGKTTVIESEIEKIDKSIIELQKNRTDFSLFKEDIDRIQKNIGNIVDNNVDKMINGNVSEMYSFKNQVQTQIEQRNQIWFTENVKSTSALNSEKNQYESQLSEHSKVIKSVESGIFSLRVDGFEEIVTPDVLNDINEEQVKMNITQKYIPKSIAISEGEPLFRLIVSNTWNIVSYVPNAIAIQWEVGDYLDIYTIVNEEEKTVQVKIESMVIGDKTTYTVFTTDRNILDFIDIRTMDFKVKENIYEGFKVPNSAIVEKTFIKIPKEVATTSIEDIGVIKKGIETDSFVNIRISKSDEINYYIIQDFETLKIGDILVIPGEGAQTYTLSEVVTYKGVYVANSSIANFKVIDVIGQNSDYTIVNAGSQYGLKIYDKIVSDAKTVENDETVN